MVRKHRRAVVWLHWINFPLLAIMIWSGILIYWAYQPYHIGSFHFFPEWFYRALHIDHHLAGGMAMHFTFMWLFAFNGAIYTAFLIFSGEWRRNLRKYNPTQAFAYVSIVLMGAGALATGLAIYKPVQMNWLTAFFGGYESARLLHFMLTIGFAGFFLIHVTQVLRAGWNNLRGMITGYEAE